MMRLHFLQHIWFEDLGIIEDWAKKNGFAISRTAFFENETLPSTDTFDWLIIMGGPMGVNDEADYPWLKAEKAFIKAAIEKNKIVVGICLGAQLIAHVLGSKVYPNPEKEIGWFPITKTQNSIPAIFDEFPEKLSVFHWHQDTFLLPDNAQRIFQSKACTNQGFSFNKGKVIGLQFHIEMTQSGLQRIVNECAEEIEPQKKYTQSTAEILQNEDLIEMTHQALFQLLDNMKNV